MENIKVGDYVIIEDSIKGHVAYIGLYQSAVDTGEHGIYLEDTKRIKKINPKTPDKDTPIDTKIIVWDDRIKVNRHFSHIGENGLVYSFPDGATSWSTKTSGDDPVCWQHAEIYED